MKPFAFCISLVLSLLCGMETRAQGDTLKKTKSDSGFVCILPANEQATFPGGDDSLRAFLKRNLVYPEAARQKGVRGGAVVFMQFVVEEDGTITGITPLKPVTNDLGFTKEAIRVLGLMPRWIPAKTNGKSVRVTMTLPVRFILT